MNVRYCVTCMENGVRLQHHTCELYPASSQTSVIHTYQSTSPGELREISQITIYVREWSEIIRGRGGEEEGGMELLYKMLF